MLPNSSREHSSLCSLHQLQGEIITKQDSTRTKNRSAVQNPDLDIQTGLECLQEKMTSEKYKLGIQKTRQITTVAPSVAAEAPANTKNLLTINNNSGLTLLLPLLQKSPFQFIQVHSSL